LEWIEPAVSNPLAVVVDGDAGYSFVELRTHTEAGFHHGLGHFPA